MSKWLRNDTAHDLARKLVAVVAPCLRGEEIVEAVQVFTETILAALHAYDTLAERERLRLGKTATDSDGPQTE